MGRVRDEVAAGRQAYVVCPLIGESEKLEVASAEETFERLRRRRAARPAARRCCTAGMSSAEKEATMDRFRSRAIDVLVATTVIEVGVDVPNATVMVILDADRFGIAQLHQLRGRSGRGAHARRAGWYAGRRRRGNAAVEALVATTDGFELAEVDLDLRGEGTLMSTAQKGRSDLKLASLRRDRELVELAAGRGVRDRRRRPAPRRHPLLADELASAASPTTDEEFLYPRASSRGPDGVSRVSSPRPTSSSSSASHEVPAVEAVLAAVGDDVARVPDAVLARMA